MECELDQRIWAVIDAHSVLYVNATFNEAVAYLANMILPSQVYCAAIVTNAAAARFTQKEKAA